VLSWTSHPAGAGVHGVAVSVVDAQADTWGESGRRMVAQVEVWWFAAVVVAGTHVVMYAILTVSRR
jgi:hypothetical protein